MYLCAGVIDFVPFYDFATGFWNSSDGVLFFVFSNKLFVFTLAIYFIKQRRTYYFNLW